MFILSSRIYIYLDLPRFSDFSTNNLSEFLILPLHAAFCLSHRDDYITVITEIDYIEVLLYIKHL
jgi:hypothetical protein